MPPSAPTVRPRSSTPWRRASWRRLVPISRSPRWVRPRHDGYMDFQQEASDRINAGLKRDEASVEVVADINLLFRASFS